LTFFVALLLPFIAWGGSSADAIRQQLASVLSPHAVVQDVVPTIYNNFGESDLEPLVKAVWERDRSKYPNLAWSVLEDTEVRVAFGQIWGQWLREIHRDTESVSRIRNEVRPLLAHPELRVRLAVVSFLGSLGEQADIDKLRPLALADEYIVAASSVAAIASIGGKKARKTLEIIKRQASDPRVQQSAADAMKRVR
jgi:hypothetical protein